MLVGEWLDLIEPYPLLELLCVSKHCYPTVVAITYRTLKFSTDLGQLGEDVGKYSHLLKRVNGHGRVSLLVITGDPPTQPQQPQHQQDWSRPRMGITEYKGTDGYPSV